MKLRTRVFLVLLSAIILLIYIKLYLIINRECSDVFSGDGSKKCHETKKAQMMMKLQGKAKNSSSVNLNTSKNLLASRNYILDKSKMYRKHLDILRTAILDKKLLLFSEHLLNDTAIIVHLDKSPWLIAAEWVKEREVFPARTPELGAILHALATRNITLADIGYAGTQLKASLFLEGGQRVSFKPKYYEREAVVEGDPYAGFDRHNGEIAAFHLNRILDFRRTPITVGRRINLNTEIMPVAESRLLQTFLYVNNNTCFYGKCYYCRQDEAACGNGALMEGVIILWLPNTWPLQMHRRHPWGRTYRKNKTAQWERDTHYCDKVKQLPPYATIYRLLDLIDASVLDYLIGNADRHLYETFKDHENSIVLMMDNGKSFANPLKDEVSIMAPLYQCCILRNSTWNNLLRLQDNKLSLLLRILLYYDPLAPVLAEDHYDALDRRLLGVIGVVRQCIQKNGAETVLLED